jgi:DNA-binding IclR family transcriptional regulator
MLLIGESSDELRRRLGPLAWAALEVLVAASRDEADDVTAAATVREVAAQLGVAKNTAHRAMLTLRSAGLATPTQRRDTDGRYCDGGYRLTVPNDAISRAPQSDAAPIAPATRTARRPAVIASTAVQLELLASE